MGLHLSFTLSVILTKLYLLNVIVKKGHTTQFLPGFFLLPSEFLETCHSIIKSLRPTGVLPSSQGLLQIGCVVPRADYSREREDGAGLRWATVTPTFLRWDCKGYKEERGIRLKSKTVLKDYTMYKTMVVDIMVEFCTYFWCCKGLG